VEKADEGNLDEPRHEHGWFEQGTVRKSLASRTFQPANHSHVPDDWPSWRACESWYFRS
jgi:hypothetical protein